MAEAYLALPGGDMLTQGLRELREGRETVHSLLAAIGAPRLRARGVDAPDVFRSPEHRLYQLLSREDSDSAHSRYNALVRRLVSFERALACER